MCYMHVYLLITVYQLTRILSMFGKHNVNVIHNCDFSMLFLCVLWVLICIRMDRLIIYKSVNSEEYVKKKIKIQFASLFQFTLTHNSLKLVMDSVFCAFKRFANCKLVYACCKKNKNKNKTTVFKITHKFIV